MNLRNTLLSLLLTIAAGCGVDETGIPQPFPLPKPNTQLLRSSGVAEPDVLRPVNVVGLP